VRLSPDVPEHKIEVSYHGAVGTRAYGRLQPPVCRAFQVEKVVNTDRFEPPQNLLELIDHIARAKGFNPSFATAMVAQESSFHTKTVSWAKAVGLTQITPIADSELGTDSSHWPRYPGIHEMPVALLRFMIGRGEINGKNEWRLNPELSISGGLAYAQILANRWSTPEMQSRLRAQFKDPEVEQTKLTLASYNSGYSRVLSALNDYGHSWLSSPELDEARRYVNRIMSFCDYFSEGNSI
jgi:soluble lytic murein transglycosylase-like protein